MSTDKALNTLNEFFNDKTRQRAADALVEVAAAVAESNHNEQEIAQGLAALSNYDATYTNISFEEGVRRLQERITEQGREVAMLRGLYDRTDDIITSAKVALVESVTADHRWHTPEEKCPHVRCIALNKIEALRHDD